MIAARSAWRCRSARRACSGGACSMISTDSKNRAARAANSIISTAPTPKFGAIMTPTSGLCDSQPRTRSSRCSVKPLVPTTMLMPWSMHQCRWSITTSGVVKSTTTSAPASDALNSQSPWSTMATSSRSSAASTARQTSMPIRPRAPSTPTRIGSPFVSHAINLSHAAPMGRASQGRRRHGGTIRGSPRCPIDGTADQACRPERGRRRQASVAHADRTKS